uniref:Cytochrome P450 n=1 Tax=Anopheles atroparvus TaxID=41427 RepID=A0AAG5D7W5_ANOAO
MKELLARFTTDVIGNCAFGLECNSLKDPHAEFRRMGKKVFQASRIRIMKRFLTSQFKEISRRLGITNTASDVASFFLSAVKDTVQYRTKHNVQRNDFMTLLMELMQEGDSGKLSIEEASAQAFVFFLAGFETSSTAMSFCLYELALSQDLQNKARECVRETFDRHGAMTYEALMDMKYIEMCINGKLGILAIRYSSTLTTTLCIFCIHRIATEVLPGSDPAENCHAKLPCARHEAHHPARTNGHHSSARNPSRSRVLSQPGSVRSGAILRRGEGEAKSVRLPAFRGRSSELHRAPVWHDAGADRHGNVAKALPFHAVS